VFADGRAAGGGQKRRDDMQCEEGVQGKGAKAAVPKLLLHLFGSFPPFVSNRKMA